MKNKSVHSCRFVHHAKFHCIMTTLSKLFKIEFERGGTGKEPIVSMKIISLKNGQKFKNLTFRNASLFFYNEKVVAA